MEVPCSNLLLNHDLTTENMGVELFGPFYVILNENEKWRDGGPFDLLVWM